MTAGAASAALAFFLPTHILRVMYHIERSALVPYSAAQMYALVNDVPTYADFLPWCGGSAVLEESDTEMLASVTIAFKGVNKTFTTRNTLCADESVAMQMVDGPFSELGGIWRCKPLSDDASKISLELEFDFANRLVGAVIGPVFKAIADSMVESFVKEAERRYTANA